MKKQRRERVISGIYGLGVDYTPRKRSTPERVKPRDKPLWYVRPVGLAWAWKENGGVGKLHGKGTTKTKTTPLESIKATPEPKKNVAPTRIAALKAHFEARV